MVFFFDGVSDFSSFESTMNLVCYCKLHVVQSEIIQVLIPLSMIVVTPSSSVEFGEKASMFTETDSVYMNIALFSQNINTDLSSNQQETSVTDSLIGYVSVEVM